MNIDIHEIKAPGLNESDYGANIDKQFKNIDNNFRIIGNYDFIKGQPGDGVKIENVKIVADDNSSSKEIGSLLYKALKTAVESFANKSSDASNPLKDIGSFKWNDIITKNDKDGFYVPIIIHENKVNNTKEYICSAGVVSFFDNRFSAAALKQPNLYNNDIVDVTSLLNFKKKSNDEWVCDLNLSFPRLKFKDESFYWVINDQETSIKATGLKGDRGSNGTMVIGRTEYINKTNSKTVVPVELLVDDKWVDKAPDYLEVGDIITVLCPIKADDSTNYTYNGFFISNITRIDESGTAYATYRPEANITQINYSKDTVSFFEALGSQEPVDGAQPARGMFLLFDNFKTTPNGGYAKDDSINDNYAHMIYNDKQKLYISPVDDYKSNEPELINSNDPELNINYKTNISKELTVSGTTSISGGLTVCSNKLSVPVSGATRISGGLTVSNTPNSFGVSGQISIPSSGGLISVLATNGKSNEESDRCEIQCGAAIYDDKNNYKGIRTIIFGETLLQAGSGKANNITVHPKNGITINGREDGSGINITGTTTIKSAASGGNDLTVNSNGVGINATPTSSYALNVGGATNISGNLAVASAEITGALSAGSATITGDITTSGGHVHVNKNIYFTERDAVSGKYTHHIETKGAENSSGSTTGTKDTSLTIWASTIQLSGNKDNDQNIIYLGNGAEGCVDKNMINIQGKTNISRKLTVTSGGAAISGTTTIKGNGDTNKIECKDTGTTITGGTTIKGNGDTNKIECANTGTTITGTTTIQSAASNGNSLIVNSGGAAITGATTITGGTTIKGNGDTNKIECKNTGTTITGGTTIKGNGDTNKIECNSNGTTITGGLTVTSGGAWIVPKAAVFSKTDSQNGTSTSYFEKVVLVEDGKVTGGGDSNGWILWKPKYSSSYIHTDAAEVTATGNVNGRSHIIGFPSDMYPDYSFVMVRLSKSAFVLQGLKTGDTSIAKIEGYENGFVLLILKDEFTFKNSKWRKVLNHITLA